MSARYKSNNIARGGVYKRRGRKVSQIKQPDVSLEVNDEVEDLRCTETDVGITEYIGGHKGFSAVIKQRYSDFHVNEVNLEGKLVELTSLSFDIENAAPETCTKNITINDCDDVISPEIQAKLLLMHKANYPDVEIEVTEMSKDGRKKIHDAIKNIYGDSVVSNTVDRDEKKIMIIGKPKGKQRVDDWSQGMGKYVYFVLYKENMDTMEAANVISHKLRLSAGKVTYAGTKDRRAKTSQLACVPRIHPKKLIEMNSSLRNLTVGNFSIHKSPLRLGDLQGNRFRIVLRNVTAPDDVIEEATSTLKKKGFINYYGLQRFGSTSVPTHHIGRELLRGNWKEAIELILKPRVQLSIHSKFRKPSHSLEESLAKARKIWWQTRDAAAALQALGNKPRGVEGLLLMGLKRHSQNDLVNALEGIPINTRLIYLHSYQSYVWNHIVSRRLKEFGFKPIVGDLVLDKTDDTEEAPEMIDEENNGTTAETLENEVKEEESNSISQDDVSKPSDRQKNSKCTKVKVLTEEDLESAQLSDIVLPLPGYDVSYPSNVVAEWYDEILKLDGLSSASLKQNVRKYSLRGSYRKIICCPSDFSWSTVQYNDPTIELVKSDLQKVKGENIPEEVKDGKYKAVILDFCLPSAAYATMALRDLLKCDTATHHQMTLNDYFGGNIGSKREGEKIDEDKMQIKVPRLEEEGPKEELTENMGDIDHSNGTLEGEKIVAETKEEVKKEELINEEMDVSKETEELTNQHETAP